MLAPNLDRVEVTFSGAIDPASLTTQKFVLRFSSDPKFFDGNDTQIADANVAIAWDPVVLRTATLQSANNLPIGYYLVELNGKAGGVRAPGGQLLDGEFLNIRIIGNTLRHKLRSKILSS